MIDEHQPPRVAPAVLAWHGGDVYALDLPESHAARDNRCHRSAEPLWGEDAPRHRYERSHRNLDTRLRELDARLDADMRGRPRQLGADEVARRVHEAGRLADDVLRRDPMLAAVICVQAFVLWGQLPRDPRTAGRSGRKARFSSARAVVRSALARTAVLGLSAASYAVAESRGRTVARWDEVECKASHSGGSRPRAIEAVERELDAVLGVQRAGLDPVDLEGLRLWMVDPPMIAGPKGERVDWPAVLLRYRRVIAGTTIDADAKRLTAEWTDKALQERLRRAKRRLEERLRSVSEAAVLAASVGADAREEMGLLEGLIPQAKKREHVAKARRERMIPVLRSEVL